MTWWEDFVNKDRELVEGAGRKLGQGFSALPEPVKKYGGKALKTLEMPMTGVGGLVGLAQGRGLQEAAEGIREGKTVGNYLTETIPEPQHESVTLNVLQELARQGAGLATDVGAGMIGPLEGGIAAAKFGKKVLPELIEGGMSSGGKLGKGLGRSGQRGSALVPGKAPQPKPVAPAPEEAAGPWFSKLERRIEERMPNKADPQQVKNILEGVPQEEVEWRGLREYLDNAKGPVTKDEVRAVMKKNPVEIEETLLQNRPNDATWYRNKIDEARLKMEDAAARGGPGDARIEQMARSEIQRLNQEWSGMAPGGPKYEGYSTPGGENYRELLMKKKGKPPPPPPKRLAELQKEIDETLKARESVGSDPSKMTTPEEAKEWGKLDDRLGELQAEKANISGQHRIDSTSGDYISSHWEDPNVLAHLRMKDFKTPAGKKALLIDELQSDWHQAGRKHGYKLSDEQIDDALEKMSMEQYGKPFDDVPQSGQNRMISDLESPGEVPDAPFKKHWEELGLKRALREAAEGGYDELAWTPGAQQAKRYSLNKQIDTLQYNPESKQLTAWRKRPDPNIYQEAEIEKIVSPEELPGVVGKETANKLMGAKPKSSGLLELRGSDLELGGEGMKSFYDQMIPNKLNKYLKRFGVKSGKGKISGKPKYEDFKVEQIEAPGGQYGVFGKDRASGDWVYTSDKTFPTKEAAEEAMGGMSSGAMDVNSIPITPEMRSDILKKGQSMWQVPVGATGLGALSEKDDIEIPALLELLRGRKTNKSY